MAQAESTLWRDTPDQKKTLRASGPIADRLRAAAEDWDQSLVSALDLILDARFPMYIAWGPRLEILFNEAYEPIVGGKGECLGKPFAEVFPEAWPKVEALFERVLAGEAVYQENVALPLLRNFELATTWWSFSLSPLRDTAGEIKGVLGVVHETTRRRLAEQALAFSEAALRTVTDMTPAMLWRSDRDGRLTWMNRPLQTFLGLGQPGGVDLITRLHPEDQLAAMEAQGNAEQTRQPFEGQYRLKDADDGYRWFLFKMQQVWDGEGSLAGWCGLAIDIADWRAGADGATHAEALATEFAGAGSALLWTADITTRQFHAVSPEFRAVWSSPLRGDHVSWADWIETLHAEDQPQMTGALDRAAAGETIQSRFRLGGPGGAIRTFSATAFPILGPDGTVQRIGGLFVDVTPDTDPRIYLIQPEPELPNRTAHALTRAGFKLRTFDDISRYAAVADDLMPGIVILETRQDFADTLYAAGILAMNGRHLPWIVAGRFDGQMNAAIQIMKLGAADVLAYGASPDVLITAARSAQPAETAAPAPPRGHVQARQKLVELSRRERDVLKGLLAGGTNKTIAQQLSLSPRTVETYRAQLMDRLGVRNLADLLKVAAGLLDDEA